MCCLTEQNAPEGSWKCDNCGNINYPFRSKCNRQNCGADKPGDRSNGSPSRAPEENDQVCKMYLCGHNCLLIKCLPLKLVNVTTCVDFMPCESRGYMFMKKLTPTTFKFFETQYRVECVSELCVSICGLFQ